MAKKLTTEEVIAEFKKIHGDKYDYSKTEYNAAHSKVIIRCFEHGEFLQSSDSHKRGSGCPKCSGKGLTNDEVITELKEIHGDKYDYSKVRYKNAKTKIIIICKEHGEFLQSSDKHKNGASCPKCFGRGLTTEEFLKEVKKVHGDKYNYSKLEYKNVTKQIIIICSEHGEFSQRPNEHKNGSGCPKCLGVGLTNDEFILDLKKIHNDKYDYSKVQYRNAKTPITIICKKHGDFLQMPSTHKSEAGCNKCSGKGLTNDEVITELKEIHGDKYDYSKVRYKNAKTKIIIICKEHGEFLQSSDKHKNGASCPKCFGRGLTTEEFLKEVKKVHGDKYDYSKVRYKNAKTKIIIICKEHGEFLQSSDKHKNGASCPKCLGRGLTNHEFILDLKKIHGDKYNYSKVQYKNAKTPITIICQEHGEFLQTPNTHKNGYGCSECSGNKKFTNEEVIAEFKKTHGNKYNYSKVQYINTDSKIIIICSLHGEFQQTPYIHKNGAGCPTCFHGWSKEKIIEFVNSINNYDLLNMDPIELQMIISQGKLPYRFNELIFDSSDNRENTIKALKERLEFELKEGSIEDVISSTDNNKGDFNTDEVEKTDIFINSQKSIESENKKSLISLSNINNDLHVLDNELVSSCDDETVEFLIQYKLRKLWNQVLNNEFDIEFFRNENGGQNFSLLKNYFFNEYNEVIKYTTPKGYKFKYKPNLMQKLTVFRLLKHHRYGNWSGTGAGKTISFILSSRDIGAKLTVLIALNSTIEQLKLSIEEVFPDSKVYIEYKKCYKFNRSYNNYLILNFDKFQQGYSEELFQDLTNNNQIDFIAIDEIHNVKQRNSAEESIRRGTLKRLIGRASEVNKNLYVLGMSATPVINNLMEAKSLIEMVTGKEYSDFKILKSLPNALDAFKHLTLNGLRYLPKYDIQLKELTGENTPKLKIDGTDLLNELIKINNKDYLKAENLILSKKLDYIIPFLRTGTLIYSYFTTDMINKIESYVKACGYRVGTFTGEESNELREQNKNNFIKGKIDILIGSKPVGTGVDGLQEVCNRMIVLSLPWTDSEYTQLKGRIYRQGSHFDEVDIIIPQVFIQLEDIEWSWDMQRINLIRNKKTLADAAIDGVIPSKKLPSLNTLFMKSQEALIEWRNRINEGKVFKIDRNNLTFPLKPEIIKQLSSRLGEFSEINKIWSISNSSTTNKKLKDNPEDWYYYHTLYSEKRKTWNEIPYVEIGKKITRKEVIVADLGCGEDLLRKEIPENKVLSFDHVGINENVVACDISKIPLENESVDITVFSLSLMGTNYKEYLKEALRILKSMGIIIIAEPIIKWENKEEELENILIETGFNKPTIKKTKHFIYLTSMKF